MKIGLDAGHTLSGLGTSAIGVVKESDYNRIIYKRLSAMLQEKGHTVIDCTVDVSSNDLADRVKKANAQTLDLFVSIHLNCGGGQGVETYVYSTSSKAYSNAKVIQQELVKNVGWRDRGVKTANFYVLKHTNAPSLLVELGFCDSQSDMNKWDTEKICKSLFKGITGVEYTTSQQTPIISEPNKIENTVITTKPQQTVSVFDKAKKYNSTRCTELQTKLNKCGYDCGTVDGIYGEKTHNALGKIQSENGLTVDYLAGDMTFKKLDELIAKKSTVSSTNNWVLRLQKELNEQGYRDKNGKKLVEDGLVGELTLSACPTLKKGANGDITGLLQEKLNSLGYLCGTVDKDFGGKTYNAVVLFQKAKGLKQDGIFGEKSWKKLLGL